MKSDDLPSQEKIDELLDKISKYGVSSLTIHEKDFLDAVSSGDNSVVQDKMKELDSTDVFFENEYFKFELITVDYSKDDIKYIGTLYVPDIKKNNKIIKGNLEGYISVHNNGLYSLNFSKIFKEKGKNIEYDIFEFCSGLEYELDNFIDYIVQELD